MVKINNQKNVSVDTQKPTEESKTTQASNSQGSNLVIDMQKQQGSVSLLNELLDGGYEEVMAGCHTDSHSDYHVDADVSGGHTNRNVDKHSDCTCDDD